MAHRRKLAHAGTGIALYRSMQAAEKLAATLQKKYRHFVAKSSRQRALRSRRPLPNDDLADVQQGNFGGTFAITTHDEVIVKSIEFPACTGEKNRARINFGWIWRRTGSRSLIGIWLCWFHGLRAKTEATVFQIFRFRRTKKLYGGPLKVGDMKTIQLFLQSALSMFPEYLSAPNLLVSQVISLTLLLIFACLFWHMFTRSRRLKTQLAQLGSAGIDSGGWQLENQTLRDAIEQLSANCALLSRQTGTQAKRELLIYETALQSLLEQFPALGPIVRQAVDEAERQCAAGQSDIQPLECETTHLPAAETAPEILELSD